MLNRMNHRHSLFLLVLLGCATIASSTELSEAGSTSDPTILRGTDVGTFTAAATKDPQVVVTSDHAAGELTSVGSFTLIAGEQINLQTLEVTQGYFTITSANGDKLMGTYKGSAHLVGIPNVIEYDVAGLISSGTGRFESMTGAIVFHGSGDLGQGKFKDEILGIITTEE